MVEPVLRALLRGKISLPEAARILREGHLPGGALARFDYRREERTGVPEVVLGEGKSLPALEDLVRELVRLEHPAIVSRLTETQLKALGRLGAPAERVTLRPGARMALISPHRFPKTLVGRTAAVLAAGTADVPVAEEAREFLEALGARVAAEFDVGVAGLHRLFLALRRTARVRPQVYLVFAGREGALATVVAGLVDRPVIGIPVSVGYGRGARGEAALNAMLQSCAALAVVNIDAGIPAALVAAQILRQAAPTGRGKPGSRARPTGSRRRNAQKG